MKHSVINSMIIHCRSILGLALLLLMVGCSDPAADSEADLQQDNRSATSSNKASFEATAPLPKSKTASLTIREWQSNAALNSATELLQLVDSLNKTAEDFAAQPSAIGLSKLQQQWRSSYQKYLQGLMQTASTPTLIGSTPVDIRKIHAALDQWPITAGYIDAIEGYPFTGIVNDEALAMTAEAIRQQHQLLTDDTPSIGFSVLRFMLYGEVNTPRRWQDFIPIKDRQRIQAIGDIVDNQALAASNRPVNLPKEVAEQALGAGILVDYADRRLMYLTILTGQLQQDCRRLVDYWQNYANNRSDARLLTDSDARRSVLVHAQWLLQQRFWLADGEVSSERQMQMEHVLIGLQMALLDADLVLIDSQPALVASVIELLTQLAQQVNSLGNQAKTLDSDSQPIQATLEQLQNLLTTLAR